MKKQLQIFAFALLTACTAMVSQVNANCNEPTQLIVTNISNTSAVLEWAPLNGVIGFNIRWKKALSNAWQNTSSGTSSFRMNGLDPGAAYEFQVQTNCSGGPSAFTELHKFETISNPMHAPVALSITTTALFSATVFWASVPGACNYQMQWREATSSGWNTVNSIPSSTLSYNLSGLRSCTAYQFRVRTICSSGLSGYSNTVTFTTNCPVPTGTPSSHRMTNAENENQSSLNLYPNPVVDNLSIQYNSVTSGTVKAGIFNMIGKNVMNSVFSVQQGMNTFNLNAVELPTGIYFMEIENNGELIRSKFMVSK